MYYLNVSFIILKLVFIIQLKNWFVKLRETAKNGRFNAVFGYFIYISIPFLTFVNILWTFKKPTTSKKCGRLNAI